MSSDAQILAPPGVPSEPADRAGGAAVRRDFAASVEHTLWFQVGVFGLSFLLMLLPAGAGRRSAAPDGPAAAPEQARAAEGVTS